MCEAMETHWDDHDKCVRQLVEDKAISMSVCEASQFVQTRIEIESLVRSHFSQNEAFISLTFVFHGDI